MPSAREIPEYHGIFRRMNQGRTRPAASGAGLGDLIEIFQPSREHVVAEMERSRRDIAPTPATDDDGEPREP
ncbi:MAG: hypothetical protein FWG25_07805 [Promicromonosporaceae bacterium]|nr:hypothetical protein [Promicromonosporaceae bacterium]